MLWFSRPRNNERNILGFIVDKGKIIFEDAFGLADVENDVAATPETKYRSASISKWLTATATMILVEQGKLNLDEPIQE